MTSSSTLPAAAAPVRPGFIAKASYALLVLGTLLPAVTGIGTFLTGQAPMTHWVLMAHVGSSGAFSVGLALVALTASGTGSGQSVVNRFFYWCLMLAGLVVMLSGVIPMTPVFGTEGQHVLYLTHRYAGMAAAAALVLHFITRRRIRA